MSDLRKRLDTFLGRKPSIHASVRIAPGAVVVGDVTLGDHSSVWCNAILRGDINSIRIGHHTNIQDNCVFHISDECPCVVGNYVTVGHGAVLHGCTVHDEVLVGMGAVILDGVVIGEQSLIGARALVTPGTQIPPGSLVLGTPATVARALTAAERADLKQWAEKYVEIAEYYSEKGIWSSSHLIS